MVGIHTGNYYDIATENRKKPNKSNLFLYDVIAKDEDPENLEKKTTKNFDIGIPLWHECLTSYLSKK